MAVTGLFHRRTFSFLRAPLRESLRGRRGHDSSSRRRLVRGPGSGWQYVCTLQKNRDRRPIPRGFPTSNRSGRSSDLLRFRSLPGPQGDQWRRYSELRGASQQRDCSGLAPDSLFTRFPVSGTQAPDLYAKIAFLSDSALFRTGFFSESPFPGIPAAENYAVLFGRGDKLP